ncbi:MAG TPA: tRNA pseudouridine(38-40) synthase TruA [Candidatus Krumholzibacteria bacterium]|nr:tRNA pseudouridine(38-40) synthase TruA [Candidatus Krumholzibacteria bacterium]
MRTIRLNLEYDGTDFQGWQKQPGLRTVQGTLEAAIQTVCRHPADTVGCARTDAGVHALGYVASFQTASDIAASRLALSLNGCLPEDIAVQRALDAPADFHARFSARSRRYVYRISETPTAVWRRFVLHSHHALDVDRMAGAAAHLFGEHDFSSFTPVTNDANKICRVLDLAVGRDGAHIVIEVEATRFVHHMVRAIAGTLMEAGRGRMEPEQVGEVLRKKDRRLAGPTAPAHGLTLLRVRYDAEPARELPGSAKP